MTDHDTQRPNILLVMSDQLVPFLTGAYGHPVVKTPNLDRLTRRGVRYDAAYTACPLCAPARAALMTGRHASRVRCYDNAAPLESDIPCLTHYMTNAGYETVASGKLHYLGPDQLHGLRTRLTSDVYTAGIGVPSLPDRIKGQRSSIRREFAEAYKLPRVGVGPAGGTVVFDEETHFRAIQYLRSGMSRGPRKADQPFFLAVSYQSPHCPLVVPQEYWDLYEDEPIDIPEYPENMTSTYSEMDRWINAYHGTDRIDIKDPKSLYAMRRAYYGLTTLMDRMLGELLDALDDSGEADDTVIVFASDHGDMLGEKNMVQKRCFYEWSTRVALVLAFPDGRNAGSTCSSPVSLIDIAPTVLDLAGIDYRRPMDGVSLLDSLDDRADKDRYVFSENHREGVYAPCFMVRWRQYKYVYIHGEDCQLFDLNNDPGEWNNLSGHAEYSAIERDLRAKVLDEFDPDAIEKDLVSSLHDRDVIGRAHRANGTHWDYQPNFSAAKPLARRLDT